MSNTIRRKRGNKPWWLNKTRDNCIYAYSCYRDATPEELKKALVEYHSDWGYGHGGPSKWFKQREQSRFKMLIKQEFARYWKNSEYEVQIDRKYKVDYWD